MIFSESNTKIAAALAKVWGSLDNPKHNTSVKVKMKSGGEYKFEYTDLNGIFDAVKELLKENGISILQNPYTETVENKQYVCVETLFLHSSGEFMKSQPLKFPAATSMQDMGGQITYMRRYSVSAMLGISTEKDDDANGASGNSVEYQNKNKPKTQSKPQGSQTRKDMKQEQNSGAPKATMQQKNQIIKEVKELAGIRGTQPAMVFQHLKISDLEAITQDQAKEAISTLAKWFEQANNSKEKQEA